MLQNVMASARIEVQLQNAAFASITPELGRRIPAKEGRQTEERFDLLAGHADDEFRRCRQRRDAVFFANLCFPVCGRRGDDRLFEAACGQAQRQYDRRLRAESRAQSPPPALWGEMSPVIWPPRSTSSLPNLIVPWTRPLDLTMRRSLAVSDPS